MRGSGYVGVGREALGFQAPFSLWKQMDVGSYR